ncbi:MAG: electron transport complex subunit RsxE [Faecalibacterium sp.]
MAQENQSKVSILTNGIIKENPVLRLVLGTCSILAVTTAVSSALGMSAAFTFVLVCSNIIISLLRNIIPAKVHLPCYIVIIAGFVTIVQMVMHAYMVDLYNALGVFLPLIVVNCIILGRAEMFASKNSVVDSAIDGVGMGIGYTLTATLMASIREILGSGTWLGFQVLPESVSRISIMTQAPGAFFCYGILIAGCVWLEGKLDARIERKIGCQPLKEMQEGEENK